MIPLVGRNDVRESLLRALRSTADGGGCLVLEGPAGIGKSRLLDTTAREATALGLTVATARATELDRVAPLTPLTTALRGILPPLLGDGPGHGTGPEPDHRFWLVDRLGRPPACTISMACPRGSGGRSPGPTLTLASMRSTR
ncbi:hypothetical protein Misp01_62830 [Microtetraspora sp. NBRC 13810]|uniref:AAA family ATPase n=1 Tax=Microtetraspora sp. NBRC 13810 TaxID=3030990 RepID=UPI0024A2AD6F|nr:ATP-binding protein [Microtetraspora sp. NBRC 13810]GLW11155.1 hypothetical protein Misp01_62830 [Microtetraspora sp. NBRC 13810]